MNSANRSIEDDDIQMSTFMRDTESLRMSALSVVLIGPDEIRRRSLAKALTGPQASIARELARYPEMDEVGEVIEADYDVVIVDLDSNVEQALDVVESLCGRNSSITVMAYSGRLDPELLVRCMRAGAREFLSEPLVPSVVGEALVRASVRRDEVRQTKPKLGKLLVFVGPKGGSGVTTTACNFAVLLARHGKVALIDLDLQLGDAALTLGATANFTTLDALENVQRLDTHFLSSLMAKHPSGLMVLSAPDTIPALPPTKDGVERVLTVAREEFAFVVVDAGSHSIDMYEAIFAQASTVYLVTQVSIADLRNANRFVSRYFSGAAGEKLEIILNRYLPHSLEIDEGAITKALTRPAKWRLPNDYAAARNAQNTGTPLVSGKNPIARILAEMAAATAGQKVVSAPEKKKKFGLFG